MGKPLVQPKITFYILVAIAVLWGGARAAKWLQPGFVKHSLKRSVGKIEPWTSSTNYSARGWTRLVAAAKSFQNADPKVAGQALGEYLDGYAGKPDQQAMAQGKIVLLLRAEFELPEKAGPGERMLFVSWKQPGLDLNKDGTVNLAWPLTWNEGRPQLLAGNDGFNAGNCSVQDEYVYLRYRYPYRALAGFQAPGR